MNNLPKDFLLTNAAWECRRCGRMNAPFLPTCFCAPEKIKILDNNYCEHDDKSISFYHCGVCKEDICLNMKCPCCGKINDE
jgi:hypothetical protein